MCYQPPNATWIEAAEEISCWSLPQVPHMLTIKADTHRWIWLQYQPLKNKQYLEDGEGHVSRYSMINESDRAPSILVHKESNRIRTNNLRKK